MTETRAKEKVVEGSPGPNKGTKKRSRRVPDLEQVDYEGPTPDERIDMATQQ